MVLWQPLMEAGLTPFSTLQGGPAQTCIAVAAPYALYCALAYGECFTASCNTICLPHRHELCLNRLVVRNSSGYAGVQRSVKGHGRGLGSLRGARSPPGQGTHGAGCGCPGACRRAPRGPHMYLGSCAFVSLTSQYRDMCHEPVCFMAKSPGGM